MVDAVAPAPTGVDAMYPTMATPPAQVSSPAQPAGASSVNDPPAADAPPAAPADAAPAETPADGAAPPAVDLKLPENFQADPAIVDTFKQVLVDPALSATERGQKLFDMYVAQQEAVQTANTKAFTDAQEAWVAEIKSDPVLGKDFALTTQTLGKAMDTYGSDAAREAFAMTGAGNHPAIVKMFYKMATALSEGTYVAPRNPAPSAKRTAGEVLYG